MSNFRVVPTNRGGKELIDEKGYRYHINRHSRDLEKTFWRCVNRSTCVGSITTTYINGTEPLKILNIGKNHLHEPEQAINKVNEIVRGIKRKAVSQPNEPPLKIIRDEIKDVTDNEVLALLPERRSLFRTINRASPERKFEAVIFKSFL